MLLPFLRQGDDLLFQQDNACPHMAAVTQRAWGSGNLLFLQSLPQPLLNCEMGAKYLYIGRYAAYFMILATMYIGCSNSLALKY